MKELLGALRPIFRRHSEISIAYLFGSLAQDPGRPARDIDLAILLARPLYGLRRLRYQSTLIAELKLPLRDHPRLGNLPIDLVILNGADPLLAHQVIKKGVLLFSRRKVLDRNFRVQTMTRYFDARPLHDFFYTRTMRSR